MNAGDAADQVIRQIEKMIKNHERTSRDVRFSKVSIMFSITVFYKVILVN